MSRVDSSSRATRKRLLDVALGVFCEKGFRAATVREISSKARANVAAVSYHFGDKVGLYRAVIIEAKCHADEQHPTRLPSTGTPQGDLRQFVLAFVNRLLIAEACATHGKLMAWEMIEPTGVLDDVVRDAIKPTWEHLTGIVAAVLGIDRNDEGQADLLRRATASVMSQVLIYRTCRAVVERLHPDIVQNAHEVAAIADHIVEFSLQALEGIRERLLRDAAGAKPVPARRTARGTKR